MAKPVVLISLQTLVATEDREFGNQFVEPLCEWDDRIVPEFVSDNERFRDKFTSRQSFVDDWWSMPIQFRTNGVLTGEACLGPFWKRKSKIRCSGRVSHGTNDVKGGRSPSWIVFKIDWDRSFDYERLFRYWVSIATPEIAMLHLFTDIESGDVSDSSRRSFVAGVFGGPFSPGIPNIGWAMAYGRKYNALGDWNKMIGSGFEISKSGDIFTALVTPTLSDVFDNFSFFSERRSLMKTMFEPGLFWIKSEPSAK